MFRTRVAPTPVAETPERLFDDLSRKRGGADALWAHQADVLRVYHDRHLNTNDVALELPTGAGKTLPGLLIAEWRRRKLGNRVLYACPTHQLVKQTVEAASDVGIDTVMLIGSNHDWATADKIAYEGANRIGITTYSAVFNVRPALEPAQTLLFDDAHAAEQFVAASWSVDVNRFERPEAYKELLALLRPALSELAFDRLCGNDEGAQRQTQLVGVAQVRRLACDLASSLRKLGNTDKLYWSGEALTDRIGLCQLYVSWDAILIRPIIPPTGSHRHFTHPDQRIYLSATLGEGGELERSFGRSPIVRLAIPDGWDSRGAGRRFFLFPDLQSAMPPRELARAVIAEAGKALTLSPSTRLAKAANDLASVGTVVLGPDGSAESLLAQFRGCDSALLSLANRYDGLDLPHSQCRVTVLNGMPSGAHLQERFLSDTLFAGRVLRERQRTRVVQGAGRCTRGLSDHSIVIVLGDAVARFINLPDVHDALRPELQAEIDFGLDNSSVTQSELLAFVRSFLHQDESWRDEAEPALLDMRRSAIRSSPPENAELANAAGREVKAMAALWSGDWLTASGLALAAAGEIRSPSLAGYRALWTYLAAAWLSEAAEKQADVTMRSAALDLLRKAHAAARGTPWLREVQPLPADERVLDDLDERAVTHAAAHGPRTISGAAWATMYSELLTNLGQTEAKAYERGLVTLGTVLGAESYKPAGDGRTDSAWIWEGQWWLAIEAKSEEGRSGPVSLATVRQSNDQLKTLEHDRGGPAPDRSAVLIVCPRTLVDPTAAIVAEHFLYLIQPPTVLAVAQDAVAAWKQIRAQGSGLGHDEATGLIRRVMSDYHILPSDVRARLLSDPLHG